MDGVPCLKHVVFVTFIQLATFTDGATYSWWDNTALWQRNFEI